MAAARFMIGTQSGSVASVDQDRRRRGTGRCRPRRGSGRPGPATIASPTRGARHERLALRRQAPGPEWQRPAFARLHRLRPRLDDEELAGLAVLAPTPCPSGGRSAVSIATAQRASCRISSSVEHEGCALPARGVEEAGCGRFRLRRRPSCAPWRRASSRGSARSAGSSSNGLKTRYLSGSTVPCTTVSPRPQAALITTTPGKPVSVSIENMTPEPARSERTIRCTPIESATFRWSKPLRLAVADRAVGEERGVAAAAGVEQVALAAHVEEGLLLAGEARLGQVLRGGAAAHRDARPCGRPARRHSSR